MATIDGNDFNNVLDGTSSSDVINGFGGDDLLTGKGGSDELIGGLGDDTYVLSGIFHSDTVTELAGGGNDTIQVLGDIPASAVRIQGGNAADPKALWVIADGYGSVYLPDHLTSAKVEWLKIGDNAPISLTGGLNMVGSGSAETINGSAFNDTIKGQGGSDGLIGRLGNDTYIIENSGVSIIENLNEGTDTVNSSISLNLPINVENLLLTGELAINGTGNELNNVLTGNAAINQLSGGLGNDTLDGKAGADNMSGSVGSDNYVVDNAGDIVTENLSEGTDKISSSITYILPVNVENLTLTGTLAINGTGNELNNVLIGNGAINQLTGGLGNDTLDGKVGADNMSGGAGSDSYVVDNVGDVVTEILNQGIDKVSSNITYTLPLNVENLTLTGASTINGNGNGQANNLLGNSANNQLNGYGGNDILDGGLGANVLTGGLGKDIFKFTTAGHIDTITDFLVIDDTIQLENAVFTALATTGILAVDQFLIGTQALDSNDYLIYNNLTGALLYDADASGSGAAVQIAILATGLSLTNADFVVI